MQVDIETMFVICKIGIFMAN